MCLCHHTCVYCNIMGLAFWIIKINLSYIGIPTESEMKRLGVFRMPYVIKLFMVGLVLGSSLYLLNKSICKYNCLLFSCRQSSRNGRCLPGILRLNYFSLEATPPSPPPHTHTLIGYVAICTESGQTPQNKSGAWAGFTLFALNSSNG